MILIGLLSDDSSKEQSAFVAASFIVHTEHGQWYASPLPLAYNQQRSKEGLLNIWSHILALLMLSGHFFGNFDLWYSRHQSLLPPSPWCREPD